MPCALMASNHQNLFSGPSYFSQNLRWFSACVQGKLEVPRELTPVGASPHQINDGSLYVNFPDPSFRWDNSEVLFHMISQNVPAPKA